MTGRSSGRGGPPDGSRATRCRAARRSSYQACTRLVWLSHQRPDLRLSFSRSKALPERRLMFGSNFPPPRLGLIAQRVSRPWDLVVRVGGKLLMPIPRRCSGVTVTLQPVAGRLARCAGRHETGRGAVARPVGRDMFCERRLCGEEHLVLPAGDRSKRRRREPVGIGESHDQRQDDHQWTKTPVGPSAHVRCAQHSVATPVTRQAARSREGPVEEGAAVAPRGRRRCATQEVARATDSNAAKTLLNTLSGLPSTTVRTSARRSSAITPEMTARPRKAKRTARWAKAEPRSLQWRASCARGSRRPLLHRAPEDPRLVVQSELSYHARRPGSPAAIAISGRTVRTRTQDECRVREHACVARGPGPGLTRR